MHVWGLCVFVEYVYVLCGTCVWGVCERRVWECACVRVSDVAFTQARPFVYCQILLTPGDRYSHPSRLPSFPPIRLRIHSANAREVAALCPQQVSGLYQ